MENIHLACLDTYLNYLLKLAIPRDSAMGIQAFVLSVCLTAYGPICSVWISGLMDTGMGALEMLL
jgi:hypothetical protein